MIIPVHVAVGLIFGLCLAAIIISILAIRMIKKYTDYLEEMERVIKKIHALEDRNDDEPKYL